MNPTYGTIRQEDIYSDRRHLFDGSDNLYANTYYEDHYGLYGNIIYGALPPPLPSVPDSVQGRVPSPSTLPPPPPAFNSSTPPSTRSSRSPLHHHQSTSTSSVNHNLNYNPLYGTLHTALSSTSGFTPTHLNHHHHQSKHRFHKSAGSSPFNASFGSHLKHQQDFTLNSSPHNHHHHHNSINYEPSGGKHHPQSNGQHKSSKSSTSTSNCNSTSGSTCSATHLEPTYGSSGHYVPTNRRSFHHPKSGQQQQQQQHHLNSGDLTALESLYSTSLHQPIYSKGTSSSGKGSGALNGSNEAPPPPPPRNHLVSKSGMKPTTPPLPPRIQHHHQLSESSLVHHHQRDHPRGHNDWSEKNWKSRGNELMTTSSLPASCPGVGVGVGGDISDGLPFGDIGITRLQDHPLSLGAQNGFKWGSWFKRDGLLGATSVSASVAAVTAAAVGAVSNACTSGSISSTSSGASTRLKKGSSVSPINCCLKYGFFGWNSIFVVIGFLVMMVGFWAWNEKDSLSNLSHLSNLWLDPAFLLVIIGASCFILGFTGSVGSLRENTFLLAVHSTLLVALIVMEVVGIIMVFSFKDWVKAEATSGLQAFIIYYRDDPDRQNLIDWMQESWLGCCGIEGPKDWDLNIYFNCSSAAKGSREACGVPFSCCRSSSTSSSSSLSHSHSNYDEVMKNKQCGYDVRKHHFLGDRSGIIYEKGCWRAGEEWMDSNLTVICLVAVSVFAIQVIGVCLAHHLRTDIVAQKSKWRPSTA